MLCATLKKQTNYTSVSLCILKPIKKNYLCLFTLHKGAAIKSVKLQNAVVTFLWLETAC